MYVNSEQVKIGLQRFIDNEIGKKAVGKDKFLIYFAMPIIEKKVLQYINSFAQNELTKDLFDENRNLNIDEVYNMGKTAMQKSGQFVFMNIVFNETDVDRLYSYIKGDIL